MIVVTVFLLAWVLGLFCLSEQKETPKNDDAKKDDGVFTVVLKMELRSERCAEKVKDAVKDYEGVQSVKTDCEANKVTVVGKVDPAKIKKILEEETKKKVELISPQPKKKAAAGGGDKKVKENKPPKEQKKAPKNDDANKDDGVVTFVLEMDCESCAKKVRDAVKDYEGVQPEKTGCHANKVTVVGKVNPVQMKERLEVKMKKTVGLIYPQPKKDEAAGGRDKKPEEKKAEEKKPPKERTVVLKIRLHSDGCIWETMEIIRKFNGVDKVTADRGKNLVTVNGTVDIKKQVRDLKDKLKGNVEIAPAKGGGKKKDKKAADKAKKRRTTKLLLHGLWRVVVAVAAVVAHFL